MFVEATHKKLKYCYIDGKQNRRVDKCISLLLRFARDMMFERTIRMIKNKPKFRMEAIAHSHLRSETIPNDYIQAVDNSTWIVKSASVGIEPYCVALNSSNKCPSCPLACSQCNICVQEFTCTCVDYQIRRNFCKHVHACFRKSKWETLVCASEETRTLAFEEHTSVIIEASKRQAVHAAEAVAAETRSTALLQTEIGLIKSIPEELQENARKKVENCIQYLQSLATKASGSVSTCVPHFPDLPAVASRKNIEKQRYYSTKNKSKSSERKLSKPTDLEKISIQKALNRQDRSSQIIHTDFYHIYSNTLSVPR